MKLNKKLLSCLLAGTMVMAPMSAFADTPSTTITGEGTVNNVDTEVYDVVLPTNKGIEFTIDPFGLLKLENTETKDLAALVSDAAGTVTSTATAVVNKSSVGINVAVDTWLDVSGTSLTTTSDKAVAEAGNADLYLTISRISGASVATVVTNGSVSNSAIDDILKHTYTLSSAAITGGELLSGSASNAVTSLVSSSATSFSFALEDVAEYYEVTSQGAVSLSTAALTYTDSAYAFVIDGYANPKSDVWEALDKDNAYIRLNMKFTITSGGSAAYGFYEQSSDTVWINTVVADHDGDGNITDESKLTSVTACIKGDTPVELENYEILSGWIGIKWTDVEEAGVAWDEDATYSYSFVYDGVTYTFDYQY